jgi:hypothetical protein
VKSDDAEVPEYLWEEHLTAGSTMRDWDAKAMDDLRRISSWLRERMPNPKKLQLNLTTRLGA